MPHPYSIRPYRDEDRETVTAWLAASEPWGRLGYRADDWARLLSGPVTGREAYLFEEEGTAAGFAVLRPRVLLGEYLELLVVDPLRRRRGIGARLLAAMESIAFDRVKNLYVCVSDFNVPARRFYAAQGYREIGPIPDLLVIGSAELLLRKTIGPARTS